MTSKAKFCKNMIYFTICKQGIFVVLTLKPMLIMFYNVGNKNLCRLAEVYFHFNKCKLIH